MIEQPLAVPSTATASRQAERCLMGLGILGGFGHLAGRQRHTGCQHERPHRRPPSQVSVESVRPVEKTLPVLRRLAFLKGRNASRGDAVFGSKTRFPSACASGFEAFFLPATAKAHPAKPTSFVGGLGETELRKARGASRGNAVLGSTTRFPSACASGFEAFSLPAATPEWVRRQQTGRVSARCSGHRSRSCWRAPAGRVPHGRHWECSRGRSQGRGSRN